MANPSMIGIEKSTNMPETTSNHLVVEVTKQIDDLTVLATPEIETNPTDNQIPSLDVPSDGALLQKHNGIPAIVVATAD